MNLYRKLSKLQLSSNFLLRELLIRMWNPLPAVVVMASTMSLFKQRLDDYWTMDMYKGLNFIFWFYDM